MSDADLLEELYGIRFPDDLIEFWAFAKSVCPEDPRSAFSTSAISMNLVGPFDVLAGDYRRDAPPAFPMVLHYRYYSDPPEFFTVAWGGGDGHHWGYWLEDVPRIRPVVCSYYSNDAYELTEEGDSLFKALGKWLERCARGHQENKQYDPTGTETYDEWLAEVATARDALSSFVRTSRKLGRPRTIELATTGGMGLDVPPETIDRSWTMNRIDQLSYARAFGDLLAAGKALLTAGAYGSALQLAHEVWILGATPDERTEAGALMAQGYQALGRTALANVARVHTANRDLKRVDVLHPSS